MMVQMVTIISSPRVASKVLRVKDIWVKTLVNLREMIIWS